MKSKRKFNKNRFVQALTACGLAACLMTVAVVSSGCGKSSSSAPAETVKTPKAIDASAVRAAFKSADPSVKYPLEQSIRIAEGGGFADALPQLQKIATSPQLTPDQKKALDDFIQNVQNHMAQQRR